MNTDKLDQIIYSYIFNSDVVFSEYLRFLINVKHESFTVDEIQYLLDKSGDSEYVTVEDILWR